MRSKILVVEDEAAINDLICLSLETAGYETVSFRDGGTVSYTHLDVYKRQQVAQVTGTNKDESGPKKPVQRAEKKVYPNDPCPCGSGKKYKQCCGRKPV